MIVRDNKVKKRWIESLSDGTTGPIDDNEINETHLYFWTAVAINLKCDTFETDRTCMVRYIRRQIAKSLNLIPIRRRISHKSIGDSRYLCWKHRKKISNRYFGDLKYQPKKLWRRRKDEEQRFEPQEQQNSMRREAENPHLHFGSQNFLETNG